MHTKIACVRGFIFALAAFILLFSTVSQIICLWSIEYDIIIRAVDCINQSLFESIKHFHRPRQYPWFYGSRVVRNPSLVAVICLRKSKMVPFYLSGRWAGGGYFPAGESETSAVATPGLSPATAHPLRGRKFLHQATTGPKRPPQGANRQLSRADYSELEEVPATLILWKGSDSPTAALRKDLLKDLGPGSTTNHTGKRSKSH